MTLRLNGSTSGYTEIDAPAVAGNNTLVFPGGNGTNGQVLSTNGSGALSWVNRFTAVGPLFQANSGASSQSIASSVATKVTLATEAADTANCYDTTLSRFTPNVAGYYQLNFETQYTDTTVGSALFIGYFAVNGSVTEYAVGALTQYYRLNFSVLLNFNGTTDYAEFYVTHNGGGNRTIASSYFQGFLARPA